eukprot:gnl/TRDRNA2_/TRDRNA2_178808_c0_seq1.p1 gnl/TRDRNA2_/TRDRNA2_178808_c0~~gnl/TRDRNA2_/TRDRNA2_178808_c0_seq1.p1  ORF type:complete len:290 (-),score=31.88 gnl/TRDRNA2_/TRDRNA2_178808_c0_seq1:210-1079(-)
MSTEITWSTEHGTVPSGRCCPPGCLLLCKQGGCCCCGGGCGGDCCGGCCGGSCCGESCCCFGPQGCTLCPAGCALFPPEVPTLPGCMPCCGGGCCWLPPMIGKNTYGFCVFILSLSGVVGLLTEDFRVATGGYTLNSRFAVATLGCIGVPCSIAFLCGAIRPWEAVLLSVFRIVAIIFIAVIDVAAFAECQTLASDAHAFSSGYSHESFNIGMQTVALSDGCSTTRDAYLIATALDVVLSLCGTHITYYWMQAIGDITLDETKPLSVYRNGVSSLKPALSQAPPMGTMV